MWRFLACLRLWIESGWSLKEYRPRFDGRGNDKNLNNNFSNFNMICIMKIFLWLTDYVTISIFDVTLIIDTLILKINKLIYILVFLKEFKRDKNFYLPFKYSYTSVESKNFLMLILKSISINIISLYLSLNNSNNDTKFLTPIEINRTLSSFSNVLL